MVDSDSSGISGVGYEVSCVSFPEGAVLKEGARVQLWIHTVTREDATLLYGFRDAFSREIYRLLLTVSGVGPKMAASVLSQMEPGDVIDGLASGKPERFHGLSGVGKKTAERLVLELRDKAHKKLQASIWTTDAQSATTSRSKAASQVYPLESLQALLALGFQEKEAISALNQVAADLGDRQGTEGVEKFFIQNALKVLARQPVSSSSKLAPKMRESQVQGAEV